MEESFEAIGGQRAGDLMEGLAGRGRESVVWSRFAWLADSSFEIGWVGFSFGLVALDKRKHGLKELDKGVACSASKVWFSCLASL